MAKKSAKSNPGSLFVDLFSTEKRFLSLSSSSSEEAEDISVAILEIMLPSWSPPSSSSRLEEKTELRSTRGCLRTASCRNDSFNLDRDGTVVVVVVLVGIGIVLSNAFDTSCWIKNRSSSVKRMLAVLVDVVAAAAAAALTIIIYVSPPSSLSKIGRRDVACRHPIVTQKFDVQCGARRGGGRIGWP